MGQQEVLRQLKTGRDMQQSRPAGMNRRPLLVTQMTCLLFMYLWTVYEAFTNMKVINQARCYTLALKMLRCAPWWRRPAPALQNHMNRVNKLIKNLCE